MELNRNDIIKFYTLYSHYNPLSNNIGIIGDLKTFNDYIKKVDKSFEKIKYNKFFNEDKTKYTIICDDIEYSYVMIQTTEDLKNLYFKKFI